MFLLLYLLKKVEIIIIMLTRERILKQKVLKALANPPRIFYVPYSLALLNFLFWFFCFVICMIINLVITGDIPMWLPFLFFIILLITHTIFGFYSKKEPQLAQIIFSNFALFKKKIPEKLVV